MGGPSSSHRTSASGSLFPRLPKSLCGPSSILFPSLSSLNVLEQKGVSSTCVPKLHTSPLQVTDVYVACRENLGSMLRSCCFPSSCTDCSLHMAGEQGLAWQDRNEQCHSTKGSGETPIPALVQAARLALPAQVQV